MTYITRLLVTLSIAVLLTTTAFAEDFKWIIPLPPGNQTDSIARLIQASVERNTSDHLIIENMPGGELQVAAVYFKNNRNVDIIMGSSAMTIFNPIIKETVPYTDKDFDHIIFVGTSVALWVVRADSKVKTPKDLVTNTPEFVGGYAPGYNYNLYALTTKYGVKSTIVPYKGTNDILVALLSGTVDMGIMALNSNLIQQVKAGKLHIVGSSYKKDVTVDGIHIPAANKQLGIAQFSGFMSIDIQPGMDTARSIKIKKLMWNAVTDPIVIEGIKNLYLLPDASNDQTAILQHYETLRTDFTYFLKNSNVNAPQKN